MSVPPPWVEALDEAVNWLRQCYPREGCGLIVQGRAGPCFVATPNIAAEPLRAFEIDPGEILRAEERAGPLLAVVHSHPDSPAVFSAADERAATFVGPSGREPLYPNVDHAVVSIDSAGAREVAVYRFSARLGGFDEVWRSAGAP